MERVSESKRMARLHKSLVNVCYNLTPGKTFKAIGVAQRCLLEGNVPRVFVFVIVDEIIKSLVCFFRVESSNSTFDLWVNKIHILNKIQVGFSSDEEAYTRKFDTSQFKIYGFYHGFLDQTMFPWNPPQSTTAFNFGEHSVAIKEATTILIKAIKSMVLNALPKIYKEKVIQSPVTASKDSASANFEVYDCSLVFC
jgi:hypothetical protein